MRYPNGFAGLLPERFQAVASGMEGEGQKVHGGECSGQIFLSIREVRQVIAVASQHVEAQVLASSNGLARSSTQRFYV